MRHRFHAICPYFAMFPETFVRKYLVWSKPGDIVFDPFSGRGTTAFESILNGRLAAGCDVNPVAVCVSNAKTDPPSNAAALNRLDEIESQPYAYDYGLQSSRFFSACFHPETLQQILHLRRSLDWEKRRDDRFIAALALGCLHGESHRSKRYFSNRMPRTISTKPDYSVRWWKLNGYSPPLRNVYNILREQIQYRFVSDPAPLRAHIAHGNARKASHLFPKLKKRVSLIITSPPYLDTTNFREDQWLRIWFLGGPHRPTAVPGGDDRHSNVEAYWKFLEEAWRGTSSLVRTGSHMVVRMGGKRLSRESALDGLWGSLERGFSSRVQLIEQRTTEILRGQRRAFSPNAEGTKVEHDFHFILP